MNALTHPALPEDHPDVKALARCEGLAALAGTKADEAMQDSLTISGREHACLKEIKRLMRSAQAELSEFRKRVTAKLWEEASAAERAAWRGQVDAQLEAQIAALDPKLREQLGLS